MSVNHEDLDVDFTSLIANPLAPGYRTLLFLHAALIYGLHALRLGHNSMDKNLVRNLQYRPKNWLIRGTYRTI